MKRTRWLLLGLVLVAAVLLPSCAGQPEPEPSELPEEEVEPLDAEPSFAVEDIEPRAELRELGGAATFDPETQTFSWTPGPGTAGVYPDICFQVTDGEFTDEECITIYVLSSNLPPDLGAIGLRLGEVGTVLAFTLQATDPDGDELQFSARNLPPGAQFIPPTFTWVPTEAGVWAGIYFSVTDGEATVTEQMTIAVGG